MANIEQGVGFPITAHDAFSGAFDKLQSKLTGLQSGVAKLDGVIAALGVAGGFAGLAALVQRTVDAHDEMNKLSQKTGIAVGELSKLKYVADLSGVSAEALAKGVKGLSAQMVEASNSSSKASKLFTAMGVDISGGPLKTLENVASVFAKLEDGELKTTLATQLFGKAGMDLIPMLNQGAAGMQKLKEEAERLGIVMNEEGAKNAEAFNDNLRAIKVSGDALGVTLVNEIGGGLVRISAAMKAAVEDGGILKALWVGLGGAFAEAMGMNATGAKRITQINQELARLYAEIRSGEKAGIIVQQKLIDDRRPRILQLENERRVIQEQNELESTRRAFAGARAIDESLGGRIKDVLGDKLVEDQRRAWAELSRIWVSGIDDQIENEKRLADYIHKNAADRIIAETKALDLSHSEWVKKIDADIAAYESGLQVMAGMQPSMMQLFDESKKRAVEMWTQVGEAAGDFFVDLVQNSRSALDVLKQHLKDLLAQMIKIFATRWVLQLGAAAAGAGGGSALAGALGDQATSYGMNTLTGTALTAGSAYLFGTGATAVGAVGSAGAIGSGGFMSTMGTWATTLGSTGWGLIIVAAVAVVAAILSRRGGGDKVEGSSVGSFGMTGGALGAYGVSDEYGNRFVSSSERSSLLDSRLDAHRLGVQDTFLGLVSRLGGSFDSAGFGFGVSNDPAGDARSRVFGNAMVGGRNVFSSADDVDDKEVDAMLMLTSKRAILAALQATDFDDEIDKIFAGAGDVAKLTGEQIDAIIAQAREMYAVIEGIKGLGLTNLDVEALRGFALEGETIGQTFQRVSGAWMQLQDAFTSDEVKLSNAQGAIAALFEDLAAAGITLPTTKDAWLDVMRGLDQSTEAGHNFFLQMMNLSGAFDLVSANTAQVSAEWEDLNDILARYNGGTDLSIAAGRFQAGNLWAQGMSPEQLIAALRTITADDFASYSQANRALINSILGLGLNIQGLNNTISIGVTSGPDDPSLTPEMRAWLLAQRTAQQSAAAREGLGGFLDGLLTGNLSTLDPMERLDEARRIYEETLSLAQTGDLDALNRLQGASQTYLGLARDTWGSGGQYADIFRTVFDQLAGVAGVDNYNQRMLDAATASQRTQEAMQRTQVDILGVLLAIRDQGQRVATATIEAVEDSSDRVARSVQRGALATARR